MVTSQGWSFTTQKVSNIIVVLEGSYPNKQYIKCTEVDKIRRKGHLRI